MNVLRTVGEKIAAESLIRHQGGDRAILSEKVVKDGLGVLERLGNELEGLRRLKANDESVRQAGEDYQELSAAVCKLFNPSVELHRINPEGTEVGGLIDVLEVVHKRLDAIPCTCRPATKVDGNSRHIFDDPQDAERWCSDCGDIHANPYPDQVFVCTRCTALGRIKDRPAPRWES